MRATRSTSTSVSGGRTSAIGNESATPVRSIHTTDFPRRNRRNPARLRIAARSSLESGKSRDVS
jgi:hypothetical protein